jgi:hypothetical protein
MRTLEEVYGKYKKKVLFSLIMGLILVFTASAGITLFYNYNRTNGLIVCGIIYLLGIFYLSDMDTYEILNEISKLKK